MVIQAAKYLGVPPWEMAGIPETASCAFWFEWTMVCMVAEGEAKRELREHPDRHEWHQDQAADLPEFELDEDEDELSEPATVSEDEEATEW